MSEKILENLRQVAKEEKVRQNNLQRATNQPCKEVNTMSIVTKNEANSKEIETKFINKKLDKSLLPSSISDYIEERSRLLNVEYEQIATVTIGGLCGFINNKIFFYISKQQKFKMVPNLWTVLILAPGSKKTASFDHIEEIGKAIQKEENRDIEFEKLIYEDAKERLKKLAKKMNDKRLKDEDLADIEAEKEELFNVIANKPKIKVLIENDSTKEKLLLTAEEAKQGFILFLDELSKILYTMNDDEAYRSLLLMAWNGYKNYTSKTKNAGSVDIEKLSISLMGGIQPELFVKLILGNVDNAKSGFLDRFQLIYIQDKTPPYDLIDEEENKEIYRKFENIAKVLASDDLPYILDAEVIDGLNTRVLRYTADSTSIHKKFMQELQVFILDNYPMLSDAFNKYDKLIGSIAVLLHSIEAIEDKSYFERWSSYIPPETVQKAIEISKFYIYQQVKALNIKVQIQSKKEIEFEKIRDRVLNDVMKRNLPCKLRDIYHNLSLERDIVKQVLEPYYELKQEGRGIKVMRQKIQK